MSELAPIVRSEAVLALAPQDRLRHLIGSVVQEDARLELELRRAWTTMLGFGIAVCLMPSGVVPLIEQCERLLPQQTLGGWHRRWPQRAEMAVRGALKGARAAHTERNWVTHELALMVDDEGSEPDTYASFKLPRHDSDPRGEMRTIGSVEQVEALLVRAWMRLAPVPNLPIVLSRGKPAELEEQLRIVEGG